MKSFKIGFLHFFISRIRQVSKNTVGCHCDIHDYIFTKANFLVKFVKISCHKKFGLYGIMCYFPFRCTQPYINMYALLITSFQPYSADMFTTNPFSSQPHMSPDPWSQQAASM